MRILIYAMGSAGDVHPFVGVGKALQARGHEVIVATSAFFESVVTRAGLRFRAMGTVEDFERIQGNPHLWHPTKALPSIIEHAVNPSYEPILEVARELNIPGETIILASSLAWATMSVRELLDVPVVSIHLAPSLFVSVHRQPVMHGAPVPQGAPVWMKKIQWAIAEKVVDRHVLPELNRFRARHGLAPTRGVLRGWHSPDRVIALFPEWYAAPQPDWPEQVIQTGFPLFDESEQREVPQELEDFLNDGEPPVVFTPGSAMDRGHEFFDEAVKAMKLLGKRAVLISRFDDTIPADLPKGVRHFSYVPFSQVLPRAAAMVYHGGIGTCAQTLRAGIPHLLMPMAHDQLDNLSRVHDLGTGDGLPPKRFKAKQIAATLDRLLHDPAVKRRAEEVAKRFDPAGWMTRTCDLIEEMKP
ncbi:glycosyltransferase [Luteolibacter soli]|uniref:Nucleotide disphospho-sugar-binding domain-containing protein n=1 Tax=Luteolibacter soli TaxID=3135280 RepID=A0ABU9ARS7_9BACT